MADEAAISSPRLEHLRRDVENGDAGALDAFWRAAAAEGTPLVEAIPGDSTDVLVTFIWRADPDTDTVRVCSGQLATTPAEGAMARLAETDLWHRTYRLPADLRFEYLLAPNDPELSGLQLMSWQERAAGLRLDPFNPKRYLLPDDGQHPEWGEHWGTGSTWVKREQSLCELPAAPPQFWVTERLDVPKGRVDMHRVESTILGNRRVVYVYTPPADEPGCDAPGLLVLSDAWMYRALVPTPTILDNLIAKRAIPPLVAVLVDHPTLVERDSELDFGAPGTAFMSFVTEELVPWLRTDYRVTSDPSRSVVGGASSGGDTAARIAFAHPDLFGNVLSQSGSFMQWPDDDPEPEWLARQIADSPRQPIRFHLDVGSRDGETEPGRLSRLSLLQVNRHLRTVLRAKGYDVRLQEFSGGHQPLCWQGTLPEALIYLTAPRV